MNQPLTHDSQFVCRLETERLILRPLVTDDAAFILTLLNEPSWLRFIGDRGVRTIESARAYIADGPRAMYARHGFGLLAMAVKGEQNLAGICGLLHRDILECPDLGYALLERYQGGGYAREAAAAVLEDAAKAQKLPRVLALTDPANARSIRLLEHLGFRFERTLPAAEHRSESRVFALDLGKNEGRPTTSGAQIFPGPDGQAAA